MSASHYLVSLVFGAGREASAVVVMETVVKLCCGKQRVIRITLTLVCTFSRTNQKRAEGRTVSRQPRVMHKSGDRSQRVRTNHSSPQTHTHTHTVSARLTDLCRYCVTLDRSVHPAWGCKRNIVDYAKLQFCHLLLILRSLKYYPEKKIIAQMLLFYIFCKKVFT